MNRKTQKLVTILLLLLCKLSFVQGTIIKSKVNVDSIVSIMKIEEKIDFIGGYNEFNIRGYKKYGIAGCGDDGYRILLDDVEIVVMWQEQGPTNGKRDVFLNGNQEYKVMVEYFQSGGGALIQLGVKKANMDITPEQFTDRALELAKNADWVIMPVGFSEVNEGEAFDRTFQFPYSQADFINEVAKVNPNVIVLVTAGGGFETASWINNVKGVLVMWYPGQEGTLAAAEIMFGVTNPSGKLPITIESNIENTPWYKDYFTGDDSKISYSEGIFVGYRYWDKSEIKPSFPFGFGLSYTAFEYSNIKLNKTQFKTDETIKLTFNLKNTGNIAGAEVVQLYVTDKASALPRPIKELKEFYKVKLEAGEQKNISFELNKDAFMYYNPNTHSWTLEPGEFDILIGSSSVDIRQTISLIIQ